MLRVYQELCTLCKIAKFINSTIKTLGSAEEWILVCKQEGSNDMILNDDDYLKVLKKFEKVCTTFALLREALGLKEVIQEISKNEGFEFIVG